MPSFDIVTKSFWKTNRMSTSELLKILVEGDGSSLANIVDSMLKKDSPSNKF